MVYFSNLSAPEQFMLKQEKTEAYVNGNNLQKGTLYIAESLLFWINETGYGFTVEYPTMAMHAVSRDVSSFPHECIYVSLDSGTPQEEDDENTENSESTELRFVPEDKTSLNPVFQAMSACQRLHPGPELLSEDDDYEDDDAEDFCNEADAMTESDQAIINGQRNGGGDVAGMVIFEGGDPMPITPRGVNILADVDVLDIQDATVGRNDDDLVDGGVAMESENTEDDAQFEDADE